jgi:hypothetical protein
LAAPALGIDVSGSTETYDPHVPDEALTFEKLLAVAQERDEVLGLFLFGSRGRQYMVDASSDWDVCVVVRDEAALKRFDGEYPYIHGARVEISSTTIDELRVAGVVGTATEQARYAAAHVDVLLDKTGGEIAKIVTSKEWIPPADRDSLIRDALDSFINSTYRSLRYATRLDAIESVPPAVRTIFGLAGRIRPFNKYLEWELRHHPLEGWDADHLLPLLDSVIAAEADAQRKLFRRIEIAARASGYGDVVDSWEPDLRWLRGDSSYRPPAS